MQKRRLGELLVSSGALTPAQLATALAYQARWGGKLGEAVLALRLMPAEQLQRLLAQHLQVPFIRSAELDKVPVAVVRSLPADVLARLRVCPLRVQWDGSRGCVYLATHQPENLAFLDEVSFATGFTVRPVLAFPEDIERTLRRHGLLAGRHVEAIELPAEEDFRLEITRNS